MALCRPGGLPRAWLGLGLGLLWLGLANLNPNPYPNPNPNQVYRVLWLRRPDWFHVLPCGMHADTQVLQGLAKRLVQLLLPRSSEPQDTLQGRVKRLIGLPPQPSTAGPLCKGVDALELLEATWPNSDGDCSVRQAGERNGGVVAFTHGAAGMGSWAQWVASEEASRLMPEHKARGMGRDPSASASVGHRYERLCALLHSYPNTVKEMASKRKG